MSEKAKNRWKKFFLSLPSVALFVLSLFTLSRSAAGSFLLMVCVILLVPIDEWQDWLEEKFSRKWIKYTVIAIICALGVVLSATAKKDNIYNIYDSPELVDMIEDIIVEQDPDILDEIGKTE
ncbi:MAG: hypothetical protein J6K84_04015 [Oscillospiraceae bacterium]|nr:hypothetical protein [Oscillospiraceae bacterium]